MISVSIQIMATSFKVLSVVTCFDLYYSSILYGMLRINIKSCVLNRRELAEAAKARNDRAEAEDSEQVSQLQQMELYNMDLQVSI